MRKTFSSVLVVLSLIITLLLAGCGDGIGTGKVITEKKDFTNFTSVEIGSAFEVTITRADTYSVTISADETLIEYIEVNQTGSKLKIYLNPRHIFTDFTLGKRVLKAEITMPSLNGLSISGASRGTVTGFSSTSNLDLQISGATTCTLVGMQAGVVDGEVSGASRITGNLTASVMMMVVSGASSLELSGSANSLDIEVSGASRADMTNFPVKDADVEVSGASEATVYVHETMDIEVSGASRLYFIGNPTLGITNVSGASTIKHKD